MIAIFFPVSRQALGAPSRRCANALAASWSQKDVHSLARQSSVVNPVSRKKQAGERIGSLEKGNRGGFIGLTHRRNRY
jgi:hypothetical protein